MSETSDRTAGDAIALGSVQLRGATTSQPVTCLRDRWRVASSVWAIRDGRAPSALTQAGERCL